MPNLMPEGKDSMSNRKEALTLSSFILLKIEKEILCHGIIKLGGFNTENAYL